MSLELFKMSHNTGNGKVNGQEAELNDMADGGDKNVPLISANDGQPDKVVIGASYDGQPDETSAVISDTGEGVERDVPTDVWGVADEEDEEDEEDEAKEIDIAGTVDVPGAVNVPGAVDMVGAKGAVAGVVGPRAAEYAPEPIGLQAAMSNLNIDVRAQFPVAGPAYPDRLVIEEDGDGPPFIDPTCPRIRRRQLNRSVNRDAEFKCQHCTASYETRKGLQDHLNTRHPNANIARFDAEHHVEGIRGNRNDLLDLCGLDDDEVDPLNCDEELVNEYNFSNN